MPRDYRVYLDVDIIWDIVHNKVPSLAQEVAEILSQS